MTVFSRHRPAGTVGILIFRPTGSVQPSFRTVASLIRTASASVGISLEKFLPWTISRPSVGTRSASAENCRRDQGLGFREAFGNEGLAVDLGHLPGNGLGYRRGDDAGDLLEPAFSRIRSSGISPGSLIRVTRTCSLEKPRSRFLMKSSCRRTTAVLMRRATPIRNWATTRTRRNRALPGPAL